MSRNIAALGAVFIVGVLLWLVMAWRAPLDESPAALQQAEPSRLEVVAPQPSAAKPAEPSLAPAPAAEYEPEPGAPEPAPAEPPPREQHIATRPDATRVVADQIKGDQGPVAEYRSAYESENRNFESAEIEAMLRKSFAETDTTGELIKSISCRATVCKLEMRWSMARMRAYVGGMSRSQKGFKLPFALSPVSPADGKGIRLVEVYMKRQAPGFKERPHTH